MEFTIALDEILNRPIVKRYDVSIKDNNVRRIEMTGYVSEDIQKYKPIENVKTNSDQIDKTYKISKYIS